MTRTRVVELTLVCVVAASAGCTPAGSNTNGAAGGPPASSSNANATANASASAAPTFEPGSPQDIALHQPDYQANVTVQFKQTKLDLKIAKKGDAYRIEQKLPAVGNTITFVRPGQPTIQILTDRKQYLEYPAGSEVNPISQTLQGLSTPGLKFEKTGTETLDKYQATKYRATKEGEEGYLVLYSVAELSNMIVKIEGQKEDVSFNAVWSEITLNPSADAVAPPADLDSTYKKIDPKDFTAMFSAPEGGGSDTVSTEPAAGARP